MVLEKTLRSAITWYYRSLFDPIPGITAGLFNFSYFGYNLPYLKKKYVI
jgi:hypothetical protein